MSNAVFSIPLSLPAVQFERRIKQLNERSVTKHYQAFVDIDWDSHPIEATDPRFVLPDDQSLGATDWYRELPIERQALIGLDFVTHSMKTGLFFENILQRGLLNFALTLPDGDPSFRYAYHEVIEEAQHSLMFQEFINRSGRPGGQRRFSEQFSSEFIVKLGRTFPELFMLFVLGGEEPIDYSQRETLKSSRPLHPLLARIMQIHVTEEARHLCFARAWLKQKVPGLSPTKRRILKLSAPILLRLMAKAMLDAPQDVVDRHGIPRKVIRAAFQDNPEHQALIQRSLSGVVKLCQELGLIGPITRHLWRWSEPTSSLNASSA